jgi:hypothetical protein
MPVGPLSCAVEYMPYFPWLQQLKVLCDVTIESIVIVSCPIQ